MASTPWPFPSWNEEPPEDYPYQLSLLMHTQERPHSPVWLPTDPHAIINDCGKQLMSAKDYRNALWKYENCWLIAGCSDFPLQEVVKYASNCTLALLKLYESEESSSRRKKLLLLCKEFCTSCLRLAYHSQEGQEIPASILAKVHYRMGEVLRLENNKAAVNHYTKSYYCQSDVKTLSRIILLNGGTSKQIFRSGFINERNLKELFQYLLISKDVSSASIKKVLSEAKLVREFSSSARKLPVRVGIGLFKLFSKENEDVSELVKVFLYEQHQIEQLLDSFNDKLCCDLLDCIVYESSQPLMRKLTPTFRTEYLIKCLQKDKEEEKVILLTESGEFYPDKIDIALVSDNLLLHSKLVKALLEAKVNPMGLKKRNTKSPLERVARKCGAHTKSKQRQKQSEGVQSMKLFIEAGADIEDLCAYHQGNLTTPLHVATELALKLGDFVFLKLVCKCWKKRSSILDRNNKTPLHIAAENHRSNIFKDVWNFLVSDCNIDMLIQDNRHRTADSYLPSRVKDQLEASKCVNDVVDTSDISQPEDAPLVDTTVTPPAIGESVPSESPLINTTQFVDCTESDVKSKVEELLEKPDSYFLASEYSDSSISGTGISQCNEHTTSKPSRIPKKSQKIAKKQYPKQLPFEPESQSAKWDVEILDSVEKRFKKLEPQKKKAIFTTIQKLAEGKWNEDLQKKISESKTNTVFEARINNADRLLYTLLDRFSETDTEKARATVKKEVYVIKPKIVVLDIVLDHRRVPHHAERVLRIIDKECHGINLARDVQHVIDTSVPRLSLCCDVELTPEETTKLSVQLNNVSFFKKRKENDIGVKTYCLTRLTVLGMFCREYEQQEYPIKVTDDEFDIINKPEDAPVVVLGRSGTGKTTVCLCRLWRKFMDYWDSDERVDNPLIPKDKSKSPSSNEESLQPNTKTILDDTIRSTVSKLEQVTAHNDNIEPDLQSMEEDCEHLHQVFITKSTRLCNQMRRKFYNFIADHTPAKHHQQYVSYVPKAFTEINELCFPLFLTARQFFLLIDKSLHDKQYFGDNDRLISSEQPLDNLLQDLEIFDTDVIEGNATEHIRERTEVTASYFQSKIWRKMHKDNDKLDPLLIWTEIQSFIKGSLEALESKDGVLSEKAYEDLGRKRAPNFPYSRSKVYDLFLEYKKFKHRHITEDIFDNGDFICNLNERLSKFSESDHLKSWSIDFIYVDEVQDFTQAELSVIVQCCKNPKGLFFAGDTAQTIIKGIAFRFEDLISVFHHLKGKSSQIVLPTLDMLTLNHRSHQGITTLASSITDLLESFFPTSFDWKNIPKDRSQINGPVPLFLCSKSLMEYFLILQQKSDVVTFGADQVVIVRDEHAMQSLPESLKKSIVLTVQQCKGLEFNDVLLYNFFTDFKSEAHDQLIKKVEEIWRASATYLDDKPKQALKEPFGVKFHPLAFDEKYHKTLCSELKYLYTVITRAKQHLWIYETSDPNKLPMLDYWHRRDVIKVVTESSQSIQEQFSEASSIKSTKEDWKRRGDDMSEQQLWEVARKCYQNADEPVLEKQVYIRLLLSEANEVKDKNRKLFATKQREATLTCIDCDALDHNVKFLKDAAHCMNQAGMYKHSAKLYERLHEYNQALKIYDTRLKDIESCARMKEKLGRYIEAISYCCEKHRPDIGLRMAQKLVREQKVSIPDISDIAYMQITKHLRAKSMKEIKQWLTFIPDSEQQIHIMKQAGFFEEVFDTLSAKGHSSATEAYRLASAQGMFEKGIKLARRLEDHRMVAAFQLQQATREIINPAGGTIDQGLIQSLDGISKKGNSKEAVVMAAKAKLLLAMNGASTDMKRISTLYREGFTNFKSRLGNKLGAIESFHRLLSTRVYNIKLPSSIRETVYMVKEAERVQATIDKKDLSITQQIEEFYGLEKSGNVYYMPKGQDLWIGLLEKCVYDVRDGSEKLIEVDSDGMLQLDQIKVFNAVKEHVCRYANDWTSRLRNMTTAIEKKFRLQFPFHKEIQDKNYLQPKKGLTAENQILTYLKECEVAAIVYELCPDDFTIGDPTQPLLKLLSPFSQLRLHFNERAYKYIAESKTLNHMLRMKMKTALQRPTSLTCNDWFKLWRISGIMGQDKHLGQAIKQQRDKASKDSKQKLGDYRFDWISKSHEHYFSYWLISCERLRSGGNVFVGITLSLKYCLLLIANRQSLSISIENLTAMLSIYTTALLTMLSCSYSQQNQHQKIVPLPETFQQFVQTFHMINCRGQTGIGLRRSCLETAKSMKPTALQEKVQHLLEQFLQLLLRLYKSNFKILGQSLSYSVLLKSGGALHCLILTLTVLGNIVLMSEPNSKDYSSDMHDIINYFEVMPQEDKDTVLPFINAIKKLKQSKTSRDIFTVIRTLLIDSIEGSISQIRTAKYGENVKVEFQSCLMDKIPELLLQKQSDSGIDVVSNVLDKVLPDTVGEQIATSVHEEVIEAGSSVDKISDLPSLSAPQEAKEATQPSQMEKRSEMNKISAEVNRNPSDTNRLPNTISEHIATSAHKEVIKTGSSVDKISDLPPLSASQEAKEAQPSQIEAKSETNKVSIEVNKSPSDTKASIPDIKDDDLEVDDDEIKERVALAQAAAASEEPEEPGIIEENTPIDNYYFEAICSSCNMIFQDAAEYQSHLRNGQHLARNKWYDEYQKILTITRYPFHLDTLNRILMECHHMGFDGQMIFNAFLRAESLRKFCTVFDQNLSRNCDWGSGCRHVFSITSQLISAAGELHNLMLKQTHMRQLQAEMMAQQALLFPQHPSYQQNLF